MFDDSVLLVNDYLNKDVPQESLFQPYDSCIAIEIDVKIYILKLLDNAKISQSQHIVTSIITYSYYMDNMFALRNFSILFVDNLLDSFH